MPKQDKTRKTKEMNQTPLYEKIALKNTEFHFNIKDEFNTYWEWEVTIVFYIALHLINYYLTRNSKEWRELNKQNHTNRFNELKKLIRRTGNLELKKVLDAYSFLYTKSITARYQVANKKYFSKKRLIDSLNTIMDFFEKEGGLNNQIPLQKQLLVKLESLKENAFNSF